MKIVYKSIKDIKPYKNNTKKHTKKQVENVAESIKQYGFVQPIVIDENGTIVIGHCRTRAAKLIGMKEIPCVLVDDLTEEQIKALRIVDNKTNESEWDDGILNLELKDLDLSEFEFDFVLPEEIQEDENEEEPEDDDGYYGDERERTFNNMNLYDINLNLCTGKYDMPLLRSEHHMPEDLISFNYVLSCGEFDKGVHFYIDDYQFERLWSDPHKYMERLKMFDCVLTPDFSLYLEMPMAMQIWNVFRSRLIGQIMQSNGIKVIPTLQWSTENSFDFCFDGLPRNSVVSVSTIGVKNQEMSKQIWFDGMDEAMRRLNPEAVIVYGGDIGYNFNCKTLYINNHNTERLSENK